jgi:hypothetical protein
MKLSFDTAVHAHPDVAVTLTLALLAVEGTLAEVGASVNVQSGGAAAWVIVNVCPAIVIDPVRAEVVVFAATA